MRSQLPSFLVLLEAKVKNFTNANPPSAYVVPAVVNLLQYLERNSLAYGAARKTAAISLFPRA
ncbi:hypothetical protein HanIR_Chr10g0485091 [Helianthus annuus]|nr:hypothetical protein HanIR_Chr10g0485091 [Helianthus annuus]